MEDWLVFLRGRMVVENPIFHPSTLEYLNTWIGLPIIQFNYLYRFYVLNGNKTNIHIVCMQLSIILHKQLLQKHTYYIRLSIHRNIS